jgi:hypothetical protein
VLQPDLFDSWVHATVKEAPSFFTQIPAEKLAAMPALRLAREESKPHSIVTDSRSDSG